MSSKTQNYLFELGFDNIMHDAYLALLSIGRGTIKKLQETDEKIRKYSYSQLYYALDKLKKMHFIEETSGEEKTYYAISPSIVFDKIREGNLERINSACDSLDDLFKRTITDLGLCTLQINRFYFSSIEMGFQVIQDKFLQQAKKSITFLAPPPILLKNFRTALNDLYERGISISIHYSHHDFEELVSYLEEIQPFVEKANVQINQRKHRVHEIIAYNDQYTRVAQLVIDDVSFISFPYYRLGLKKNTVQYGIDFMEGFAKAPLIVGGILNSIIQNPIVKSWISTPAKEAEVIEMIENEQKIQKSELAKRLSISGTTLKKILDRLEKNHFIEIRKEENDKGRPMEWVYLLEKE